MELVAFYNRRRSMLWYGGFLVLGLLAAFALAHGAASIEVNGSTAMQQGIEIPIVVIPPIAMFLAAMYATSAALSLNRENSTLEFSWTKPIPRPMIAVRYVAIDVAAIVLAYGLAWLAAFAVVGLFGAHFAASSLLAPLVILSIGVALMWYALLLLLTSTLSSGAGLVVGLAWPIAFVLLSLGSNFHGTAGAVIHTLNIANPFAYLSGVSIGSASDRVTSTQMNAVWQQSTEVRGAIVWTFASVFCAIAVALWSRREA